MDDLTSRRPKVSLSRQNSRQSVKSLIESIENAGKPTKAVSRSSSASSISSMASDIKTPSSPITTPDWPNEVKTPLKEQQPNKILSKNVIGEGKAKVEALQKGLEYSRRNSYSDISE